MSEPATGDEPRPYAHVLARPPYTYPGVTMDPRYGVPIYRCLPDVLPAALEHTRPPRHSWEAWTERAINAAPHHPHAPAVPHPTLRPYQGDQVAAIAAADRGYTLAYPTGAGKTVMGVLGVALRRPRLVLVVTTLTHVPAWRAAIDQFATGDTEWVVTNPARLGRLLTGPEDAPLPANPTHVRDWHAADRGVPHADFDVIVTDESHMLADPSSVRSRLWRRLARWGDTGPAVFTLNMSATPWSTPAETWPAAHLIAAAAHAAPPTDTHVTHDYDGYLAGAPGYNKPVVVFYDDTGSGFCPVGRWVISNPNGDQDMAAGMKFNVFVLNP